MARIGIDARMYSSRFTGIGRYAYELIAHLSQLDTENEYVVFLNGPEFGAFVPPGPNFRAVRVDARHYSLAEQTSLLSALRKEDLDLVHFTHFNAPYFYRRPFVVTIHDLTLSFFPGRKMASPLHRFAYHRVISHAIRDSQSIIAVSEYTKGDILKLYDVPDPKVTVTHEGIGNEFSPADPTDVVLSNGLELKNGHYLLYTGVWREHKNLKRLLSAFLSLAKDTLDIDLVITGRHDPLYGEILSMPAAAGLADRVHFVGHVSESELIALYRNARAFVFPSLYEGFGLPPLEAMSCGTPVVCSDSSSLPEVCGDAALYFDPLSQQDIRDKLSMIIRDDVLYAELRRKGLENVERFSWKTMAERTLETYRNTLTPTND